MIDPMNDAEVGRMARAIYEELVANRHWDDVPLGDRDAFVHLLRRAMLSARPALSTESGSALTGAEQRALFDYIAHLATVEKDGFVLQGPALLLSRMRTIKAVAEKTAAMIPAPPTETER